MESSNNIIHPTRLKGLGFGSSCFGRVMMALDQAAARQIQQPESIIKRSISDRSLLL
jgi:hypothetical protein